MTTVTPSPALPVSSKALPMTLGLAAFAAVLAPVLFAVSASLGFRSGGSPGAEAPVYLAAAACLLGLPCVWALISRRDLAWGLTVVLFAASLLLLNFVPDIHPHPERIKDPIGRLGVFFPMTVGIMLAAGWLGIFIRSAWRKRNWRTFGFLLTGYLAVAAVGLVYPAVLLFAE